MSVTIELSREECDLVRRLVDEGKGKACYCMRVRSESILRKLEGAKA